MDVTQRDPERLKRDVEGALSRALDPSDVLPMLHRLSRSATPGSDESVFAHRQLAELLLERHPWRAALHAKRVLAAHPTDDRGWAALAACQAMLGHYRFAATAYKRALDAAPLNASYAHNLGHLLDVALDRPRDAVPWLRIANASHAKSPEVAASFAHALARAGDIQEAKRVLDAAPPRGAAREHAALRKWLDKGAPPRSLAPPIRPPTLTGPRRTRIDGDDGTATVARRARPGSALEAALARGLARLPVSPTQRGRALALAKDAISFLPAPPVPADVQNLASAVAYAIVYVDNVPLTQGEVAACFRVSAAALRARFKDLRVRLDLTPGDARYATLV